MSTQPTPEANLHLAQLNISAHTQFLRRRKECFSKMADAAPAAAQMS